MNRDGCKDPVAETAVSREYMREKLREQYRVNEGDVIHLVFYITVGKHNVKSIVKKYRVKEIHKYHITMISPKGFIECFQWWEFAKRRR